MGDEAQGDYLATSSASAAAAPNGGDGGLASGLGAQTTVGGLRFLPPKVFDGTKDSDFENFAFKLRSFLCLANPKFRKLMKDAQESSEKIDFDLYDSDEQRLAVQMQHALTSLTDGSAAKIAMKDDEYDNGFESWTLALPPIRTNA